MGALPFFIWRRGDGDAAWRVGENPRSEDLGCRLRREARLRGLGVGEWVAVG